MERLCQELKLLLFLLMLAYCSVAFAKDYCALNVRMLKPSPEKDDASHRQKGDTPPLNPNVAAQRVHAAPRQRNDADQSRLSLFPVHPVRQRHGEDRCERMRDQERGR